MKRLIIILALLMATPAYAEHEICMQFPDEIDTHLATAVEEYNLRYGMVATEEEFAKNVIGREIQSLVQRAVKREAQAAARAAEAEFNPGAAAAAVDVLIPLEGQAPRCGDGEVNQDSEQCDPGAPGVTADCDPDCTVAECGDGYRNNLAGESCDSEDSECQNCEYIGGPLDEN